MTRFVGKYPGATFGDVLTTTNNGQGLPASTLVQIQDGFGNNSSVSMSQQAINFDTTGPNQWRINNVPVTVSASQLNALPPILPAFESLTVNTNLYTDLLTVNVIPYEPSDMHWTKVTFTIQAEPVDDTLNVFGCTASPLVVFGYQSSAGLNIVGSTTGTLNQHGMNSPNFRWVVGVDQITLQVQELDSSIRNLYWAVDYVVETA